MKIGFIAPYQDLIAMVEHVRQDNHTDVELIVKQATYTQAIREVRKMEAQGVEAIISRGATVAYIEQYTKLPVIRCDYGVADLLYALREAKKFSSRVGVITYASHAWMKSILEDLCQMDIFFLHGYKDELENRQFVERLRRQGIDVIVGGIFSVELAEQFGMHGVLIPTRPETIALSVAESARVVRAIHKEREALEEIRQIINHVNDAILLAESEGNILMMNPSARALLRRLYRHGDVTSIFQLFSDGKFRQDVQEGVHRSDEVRTVGGVSLLLSLSPIRAGGTGGRILLVLQEVSKIQSLEKRVRAQLCGPSRTARYTVDTFLGESPSARRCRDLAVRYARLDASVVILGESGTGKEILAQSIHNASGRKNGPFVAVNCSAIPPNLLERELFGYEEGAFTGAKKGGKPGLFELAHQGTLFLDEIGEIPREFQSALLRVLQEKELRRVGSERTVAVDVRIIAATNADLAAAVREGLFRMDLYFRLCVLELPVPPLRERREDIPQMARYFCGQFGGDCTCLTDTLLSEMTAYDWPGNVRELRNFMEKVSFLSPGIPAGSLLADEIARCAALLPSGIPESDSRSITIQKGTLEDMEQQLIQLLYNECGHNKTLLAERLNVSRVTVWNKLNKKSGEGGTLKP